MKHVGGVWSTESLLDADGGYKTAERLTRRRNRPSP
jgi:hypothetical protein